ncbi:MAG: hypothetical protein DYG98_11510 [Haliscomenobacteraceae bacterium CHB4]|nr:hypothetical protein [Saprospiraceae bacterium]MCE7923676.1 hypothetical protein [Haliscomenobacteraceae bacterium CHB4]
MKHYLAFWALSLPLLPLALPAQDATPVALVAEEMLTAGKIGEAAAQYEQAARLNANNSVMLYKAAEAYYRVRDYEKAVSCYSEVQQEYERYELAGLRYARSLKQSGRYTEAMEAFKEFARRYKGARKAQIIGVVTNEVKGCEMALEMAQQQVSAVLPAEVNILPAEVNSPENEFAPVPFSDNLLYFSTLAQGRVQLMRSHRKAGTWQAPSPASGLPASVSARYGNGTFSPDGNRFYCTQCDEPSAEERGGNGLRTRCNLFLLRRTADGTWSEPERLRDYINVPNHTATHPFVVTDRGRELLFFASDREGGFGGLDLYVCERPLDSDDLDFSFPQNLGNTVNTAGDEVTPFFDPASQTLWFSSNSHVSLGGLDVFKSVRAAGKWSKPENAGMPVNSPADDFFLVMKKNGGGFFVSNRHFGAKTSTRDEDVFEFFPKEPPVALTGTVLEQGTNQPLSDCMVALYEVDGANRPHLLEVRPSANGTFRFSVAPRSHYRVEVTKEGYETSVAQTDMTENELMVLLERSARFTAKDTTGATFSLADLSPAVPARQASVYRVHLEIQPDFNAQAPRYGAARAFGNIIAEPLPEQGIVRVLLGDFPDAKTANDVAVALRIEGAFPQAFVVKGN